MDQKTDKTMSDVVNFSDYPIHELSQLLKPKSRCIDCFSNNKLFRSEEISQSIENNATKSDINIINLHVNNP